MWFWKPFKLSIQPYTFGPKMSVQSWDFYTHFCFLRSRQLITEIFCLLIQNAPKFTHLFDTALLSGEGGSRTFQWANFFPKFYQCFFWSPKERGTCLIRNKLPTHFTQRSPCAWSLLYSDSDAGSPINQGVRDVFLVALITPDGLYFQRGRVLALHSVGKTSSLTTYEEDYCPKQTKVKLVKVVRVFETSDPVCWS